MTLDQSRYCLAVVKKYLGDASPGGRKVDRPLPTGFEASKEDSAKNQDFVQTMQAKYGIHYASCIGALIYLTATRTDIIFAVHKLARFMSAPGKRHFWAMVHLLHYLRDNVYVGLKYYHDMRDAPVTELLRQAELEVENSMVVFSDSSWQDCPDTGRSTGCFLTLYQGGVVDHHTHMPVPVALSSAEAEYNYACVAGMSAAHHRMLYNRLRLRDPDDNHFPVPIILDSQSAQAMGRSFRDTKHTRHVAR